MIRIYKGYIKDFTKIFIYEFDCGSEWTRTECFDTCKFYKIVIKFYSVRVSNMLIIFIKFFLKKNINYIYNKFFKLQYCIF